MNGDEQSRHDSLYWDRRAAAWERVRPPWRPTAPVVDAVRALAALERGGDHLLLGVTPELAALAAEAGPFLAVDRSPAMIRSLWREWCPGARVERGEWSSLPLASGAVDRVIGDGILVVLSPELRAQVAAELHRVLRPGGLFVTRVFSRSPAHPDMADVIAAFNEGLWPSSEALRMAMAAALNEAHPDGAPVRLLWPTLTAAVPDLDAVVEALGWDPAGFRTFQDGLGTPDRLCFPPSESLESILHPWFTVEERLPTNPEVAGLCQVLCFRRR